MNINKLAAVVFVLVCAILAISSAVLTAQAGCSDGSAMSGSHGMSSDKHNMDMKHEPNMGKHACSSEMMQKYQFLATMPIYLDSPTVIYGRAKELGLSQEQKVKLLAITEESRKNALALLTVEQRQKLGDISNEPITMSQICPMMNSESINDHSAHNPANESVKTETTKKPESAKTPEQTTCPVMGGAINKNLFTVYQGKTVYFCCPGCKGKFESEPDKYIAKLPQFAK